MVPARIDLDTVFATFKLLVTIPATRPYLVSFALFMTSSAVLQCFWQKKLQWLNVAHLVSVGWTRWKNKRNDFVENEVRERTNWLYLLSINIQVGVHRNVHWYLDGQFLCQGNYIQTVCVVPKHLKLKIKNQQINENTRFTWFLLSTKRYVHGEEQEDSGFTRAGYICNSIWSIHMI